MRVVDADQWPTCKAQIAAAVAYGYGTVEDIAKDVGNGDAHLWKNDKACAVTQVLEIPDRILHIKAIGGTDMHEWIDEAIRCWREFAKEHECTAIYAQGRPGWRSVFKQFGFRVTHITGVMEV